MPDHSRLAAAACLLSALMPTLARADPPPPAERAHLYSTYEAETIDSVLEALAARVDPEPEGKTIERIDVVPLEIFEARDKLPQWLNVVHARTRPFVIRREVLLHAGDAYRQVLADDTLRNLRHLDPLSVVLVVTAAGSRPDRVRVVVITKDVWSIRADWSVVATNGGTELLALRPAEWNVAGTHHRAEGLLSLAPSSYTLGLGYTVPRLVGSRIAVVTYADVVLNRASGAPEGSHGGVIAGEPLFSGPTRWAWDGDTSWSDYVARRYVNAQPSVYKDPATGLTVPFEYRTHQYSAAYTVTRSFGWDVKHDIVIGVNYTSAWYRADSPGADPRTLADFVAANVPVSDTRAGPSIQYHSYTKRYVRLLDFESLALQEDAGLGHEVVVRAYPSLRAFGASVDLVGVYAGLQYTFAVRDGLFRVLFSSTTEHNGEHTLSAAINPAAHLVTPTIANAGRLVVDTTILYRWRDYLNVKGACPQLVSYAPFQSCDTFLGGNNRLRGYPTNFFVGKDLVAYNVEARTRPVDVLTCQLAGVAFYDVGDAFNGFSHLHPYQSVGFGLRGLFPWLGRVVFSADIGFPVERPIDPSTGAPVPPYGFIVSFGQAFPVPTVALPSILPTGQSAW
jgi:hypothetical protein